MVIDPSDPVTALFRLPPQEFIAARDGLAGSLRDDGRDAEAKAVRALRKPSVSAWALNQLAARDPEGIRSLLEAGAELRAAQQATLSSGRDAGRMRTASEARREAVTSLTRLASEVLAASGRASSAHLDDVTAALEAASIDPETGEVLSAGMFERPPSPPIGLGETSGLTLVPSAVEVAPTPVAASPQTRATLDAEIARLRRDRDAAVRTLAKDRGSAELLEREGTELHARLEYVLEKGALADARVKAAEVQVQAAERALKRAQSRAARRVEPSRRSE